MPFFSVIIATYNRAAFLPDAIRSVLNQRFSDFDLIIVDDGSTDDTAAVVKSYTDHRLHYIYQENAERSVARNNGVNHSKGSYLCFLDSDDLWLPNHLQTLHKIIQEDPNKNERTIYATRRVYRDLNGKDLNQPTPKSELTTVERALMDSPPIQCIAIKREFFLAAPFTSTWLPYSECNDFFFRLAGLGGEIKDIDQVTVVMQIHDFNTTNWSLTFARARLNYLHHHLHYVPKSPALNEAVLQAHLGVFYTEKRKLQKAKALFNSLNYNPLFAAKNVWIRSLLQLFKPA